MGRSIQNLIPSTVPMWAVFYDDGDDEITFKPIIALALVQDGDYVENQVLVPIHFSAYPITFDDEDWEEFPHFNRDPTSLLGHVLKPDAHEARERFRYAIQKYRDFLEKEYGP